MKPKFASLLGVLFFTVGLSAQNDPAIMTINGKPILKSEFEYIYNKNNANNSLDKKNIEEYVDLFINFKLKVEEAKAKGIHERKSYIEEFETYKNQLAAPYMTDKETEEAILREAYARMKEDVDAGHILVKTNRADTAEAYERINQLYERLKNGENFETLAAGNSQCPSSEKGGRLGYITAFMTVYPFETAAYNTPVGTFGKPVKTSFGYHIVKVYDRRPSKGSVRVGHIFKRVENNEQTRQIELKADSIYQLLQDGADFAEIAGKFSDDRQSANNKGDMGWVETGRYPVDFENAAFALKNPGDLSNIIHTAYGFHILKLLERKELGSYESLHDELKAKILRDERASRLNDSYVEKLKRKHGFNLAKNGLTSFYEVVELTDEQKISKAYARMESPLYTLNGATYSQKEFVEYFKVEKEKLDNAKQNKNTPANRQIDTAISGNDFVDKIFAQYVKKVVIAAEQASLEKEHPEYRNLLREYSDGLLLFEVSNEEVWNKASVDVEGLEKFFEANKENYKWESPRFRGKVLHAANRKILAEAQEMMKNAPKDSIDIQLKRKFNAEKVQLKIENGLFAPGANKAVDAGIFKKGTYTDEAFPAVDFIGDLVAVPESYKDVRGPATADYQNYLEEEWIKNLRKKYNVTINEKVLKSVKSN
ncbi:MAG: peptidylprolyl isomerase [Prevotellaceae bacterium]|jgi:peptidyl-prolyl cis-trans isomerase SurA|nr:peptidylprolyl isomerase [Prevotellaceae bacterium]